MIIQSISSLSTTPGTVNDVAEVLGYYTKGDGGGGSFYWSATSPVAPNGGTVFSANGTGFWVKLLNGTVSVKEFGAKGDGVTDDTVSLQNAAKYVSEYNMHLFFPPASYLIGADITFNGLTTKTDYSCSISGENAVLIKKGDENTYFNMFRFEGANTRAKVTGITFDGRRDQINSYWASTPVQFGVSPCVVTKRTIGIASININAINIDRCYFLNIHGRAIYDYYSSKFVTVSNSYFINIAQDACASESAGTIAVNNCHFENVGILPDNFFVDGVAYSFDGTIGGKKWYHTFGDGVVSRNAYTKVSDCTFININRIAVVSDIASGTKMDTICSNNSILHDHLRLRCANPQGSIWLEQGYSGMVSNNSIKYINRAVDDLPGVVISIAQSSDATEGRFVVDGNLIDTTLANKTSMSAIIVANSPNRQVFINNNNVYGPFIFCLNFSFQITGASFNRVSVTNNHFDNTSTAANSSCINKEYLPNASGTIEEFTLKGNFLKQGNLSDTRDPYLFGVEATYPINYIEDNNFNNASISLSYARLGTYYIKGNIGVRFLRSLLDTTDKLFVKVLDNEIDYIQMHNQFAVSIPSMSGFILRNKLKGISIHAADDLTISGNEITPENTNGININPLGKNIATNKLRIFRNSIIIPASYKGISVNNSSSAQLTNSIISNNTIDGESNASTIGVTFATAGNRSNVVFQDNTIVRVTTAYVNPA
ncbi:right-handed parallel beta-helix repeat-containing protein [Chitinophaga eiseniae]|uniref:Pectate lyase superfamily protein n=1 Tax=Chitinophaga eiseniae TaxID=634771 RepID=A0A847SML5_9BACT|nr:glycosyl hydrolase family 28-related protein [Chitinophaga eiseniae]NLR81033.1 hypothetical protein [Chitinophaga eiseniae]